MEKLPCSIFNDVLGPVMRGPSSSHVGGAARIASMIRQSLDAPVKKAIVDFVHRYHFRRGLRAAGCSRRGESAAGRHAVWREYSVKTLKWGLLYTAAFLAAFVGSALLKMNSDPTHGKYNTRWDDCRVSRKNS